jgi:YihY family inner membrane protein
LGDRPTKEVTVTLVERFDRYQRRHRRLGVPIAVLYKFVDDQGTYLAAIITYYAIVSLFPLLLLLSTVLSFVLAGHPNLQQDVVNSALGQFPVVGDQLHDPSRISGSGAALAVGIIGTIYGGLGVAQAVQNAMNVVWRVPRNARPNPIKGRLRSLLLLLVFGLSIIGTTILSALGSNSDAFGASVGVGIKVLLLLASLLVNSMVFILGIKTATARDLPWRCVIRGAVAAAIAWQLLQFFGTVYIGNVVRHATALNSVFAFVLGLIVWIYLEAVVVVLAVEYDVVRELRLYPRSLLTPFTDNVQLTGADRRAYTGMATSQQAKGFEDINVTFDKPDATPER